jgi:hypothetical protein
MKQDGAANKLTYNLVRFSVEILCQFCHEIGFGGCQRPSHWTRGHSSQNVTLNIYPHRKFTLKCVEYLETWTAFDKWRLLGCDAV